MKVELTEAKVDVNEDCDDDVCQSYDDCRETGCEYCCECGELL